MIFHDSWYDVSVAENGHTLNHQLALVRVIINETDGAIPVLRVPEHISCHHLTGFPGSYEQHLFASVLVPLQPHLAEKTELQPDEGHYEEGKHATRNRNGDGYVFSRPGNKQDREKQYGCGNSGSADEVKKLIKTGVFPAS